jgi:hypothetical protein
MTLFTVKVRILELRYGRVDLNGGMAGVAGELGQVRKTFK